MLDRKLFLFAFMGWFLALATGILIGTAFSARDAWDPEVERWLKDLEGEVGRLKSDYRALKVSVEERDLWVSALLEEAVKERLTGTRFKRSRQLEVDPGPVMDFLVKAGAQETEEPAEALVVVGGPGQAHADRPSLLLDPEQGVIRLVDPGPGGELAQEIRWDNPLERIGLIRTLEDLAERWKKGDDSPKSN